MTLQHFELIQTMSHSIYYGRVSTSEQNIRQQQEEARTLGCNNAYFDEGVSGYHVSPSERREWQKVMAALRAGDTLYVRWLDRISRRYDELHATMQELMKRGVTVHCTMNGMYFDGASDNPIAKATRDAILAFMAAQGEMDYLNRKEMQRRGIELAKQEKRYNGRPKIISDSAVASWRVESGASIKATAEHFAISESSVKRAMSSVKKSV
ncbi:recombinase family protein [uncultured Deefgea sp.]|uniref:recombinase family protein n=1 Tax=uncultured Deefgea sp. TaxID=1304914 RepID=UPI002592772F|nr:recombinase family protein [uncultured Deefgea sp.]